MPPSEPPKGTKSRAPRRKRRVQPPSTEALKGRAYGTRPARPLPKPSPPPRPSQPAPQRQPPSYKPTATQLRSARSQRAGYVSSAKATDTAAYKAKPLAARRRIIAKAHATPVSQRTPEQKAAMAVHHGRHSYDKRAQDVLGYLPRVHARSQWEQMVGHVEQGAAVENAANAANAAAKVVREAKQPSTQKPKTSTAGFSLKPGRLLKGALKGFGIGGGSVAGGAYTAAKAATSTPKPLKESPAETAVKQTQRGAYAVKNVINEDIKRHGVKGFLIGGPRKASASETKAMRQKAKRGFQLKEKTSGADILKTAGVKNKTARAAGGLAIDVAAESATTPGFGVGSVGARAAARAGRTAERAALKAGAEKAAAKAAGQRAARRIVSPAEAARAARTRAGAPAIGPLRQAEQKTVNRAVKRATTRAKREAAGRGVAVRYVGHEIPGSRRATAAVGRAARKVARRGPAKTRAQRRAEHEAEHVIRTARVEKQAGHAEANRIAAAAHASLRTDEERAAVAHALDSDNISSLTPSWRKALKEAKGDKGAAQKIMEDKHPDEVRLARAAVKLRGAQTGAHVAERQANVAERTEPENFLSAGDKKDLRNKVEQQQRQTKRAVQSAQREHERARAKAQLQGAVADVRHGAERIPGKRETRSNVKADEALSTLRSHQGRRVAARNIPEKGRGKGVPINETDRAYLDRLAKHAKDNDLPQLQKAAEGLLAKAPKDVARGYFPRVTEDVARKQLGIAPRTEGATSVRAGTARQAATRTGGKARKDVRPLNTVQAERAAAGEAPLSEHPALVVGGRVREARAAVAESDFARNLARLGRPVTHESQLRPGEELHYLGRAGGKYGLHAASKVIGGRTPRQYVAMPAGVVEHANRANAAVPKFDSKFTRALDATTNFYKGLVTRNPMFHMKNSIGDLHRLVFEVGAPGKIRSFRGAARGARAVHAIERFQAGGKAPSEKVLGAKISLGSETVTAAELAARLKRHGMIDQGRSMQEQLERELMGQGVKEGNVLRGNARSVRGAVDAALNPPVLTQEAPNTIRATAWIAGKRMGLSDGEAADFSHKFFIDYAKLTPGERQVGRRIAPFYTWTRQALPATLKNFAQNPARYGNMEAARNEWNQMVTGMSEDELDAQMSPFTRRELPFIFPVGHDKNGNPQFKALSASFAVNLLNNLPTSSSISDLAQGGGETEQSIAGLLNPLIRTPLELGTLMAGRGGNDLRGRPIEDPFKPVKPAPVPDWVKGLPKGLRDELQVTEGEDPKTGKKTLVWRGKADYGYRILPSAVRKAIDLGYTVERGGVKGKPYQTRPGLDMIFAGFGITSGEVSAAVKKSNDRFELVKQLGETNRELQFLPAGVGRDHPTPKWRRLRAKVNALQKQLDAMDGKQKKGRRGSGIDIGLGSGSGPKIDIGLGKGAGPKIDIGLGG